MSDEVKLFHLCPDCGFELAFVPDEGSWFCVNCCRNHDTVRAMVSASDYDTLRAERDALQARVRALVEKVRATFDPGGALDYAIDEWASEHEAAIDALAAAFGLKEA